MLHPLFLFITTLCSFRDPHHGKCRHLKQRTGEKRNEAKQEVQKVVNTISDGVVHIEPCARGVILFFLKKHFIAVEKDATYNDGKGIKTCTQTQSKTKQHKKRKEKNCARASTLALGESAGHYTFLQTHLKHVALVIMGNNKRPMFDIPRNNDGEAHSVSVLPPLSPPGLHISTASSVVETPQCLN